MDVKCLECGHIFPFAGWDGMTCPNSECTQSTEGEESGSKSGFAVGSF